MYKGVGFMLSEKQFIEEEKDCAAMLGLTLEEYRKEIKETKVNKLSCNVSNRVYDNLILSKLGLSEKDLKRKR